MRILKFIAAIAATSAVTFAHAAPAAVDQAAAKASAQQRALAEASRAYVGSYRLDDGRRLEISEGSGRFYAQLGRGQEFEVKPVAQGEFQATSRDFRISFAGQRAGGSYDVAVSTPSADAAATLARAAKQAKPAS
jgi:hypothetical protein